jgi:hypothetical protein
VITEAHKPFIYAGFSVSMLQKLLVILISSCVVNVSCSKGRNLCSFENIGAKAGKYVLFIIKKIVFFVRKP